ncbi:hypothetical protein BJ742DRAFT_859161 [Cladochytrium replicatum]|nr:hypothetical protein BJ742DRAFT_859161 [Cladochytrium replicatum]
MSAHTSNQQYSADYYAQPAYQQADQANQQFYYASSSSGSYAQHHQPAQSQPAHYGADVPSQGGGYSSSSHVERDEYSTTSATTVRPPQHNEPVYIDTAALANEKRKSFTDGEDRKDPHARGGYSPVPGSHRRQNERRFCCCFRTRRGCWMTICLTLILILVGLGVTAFFIYPRIPTFTSPTFTLGQSNALSVAGSVSAPTTAQPFNLTLKFNVQTSGTSDNYINYDIRNLTIVVKLLNLDGSINTKVTGTGILLNSSLKSKTTTNFVIPASLSFVTTTAQPPFDEALIQLMTSCGALGEASRTKLRVKYDANLDLPLISWLGIRPTLGGTTSMDCPFDASAWASIPEVQSLIALVRGSQGTR